VHIDALELDEHAPAARALRQREALAIPAGARRDESAAAARRAVFVKDALLPRLALNAVIVRQINVAPRTGRARVKLRLLRVGEVAAMEAPVEIEGFALARRGCLLRGCGGNDGG